MACSGLLATGLAAQEPASPQRSSILPGDSSQGPGSGADHPVPAPSNPTDLGYALISRFGVRTDSFSRITFLPDLNRDGAPEIGLLDPGTEGSKSSVFVLSARTGRTLYCLVDFLPLGVSGLGTTIDYGPDIDGDGVPDFAVGAASRREVALLSGVDGRSVRKLKVDLPGFGASVGFSRPPSNSGVIAIGAPTTATVEFHALDGKRAAARLRRETPGFGRLVAAYPRTEGVFFVVASDRDVSLCSSAEASQPLWSYPLAEPASSLRSVDLDGDEIADIAAATEGSLLAFLGPTFPQPVTFACLSPPTARATRPYFVPEGNPDCISHLFRHRFQDAVEEAPPRRAVKPGFPKHASMPANWVFSEDGLWLLVWDFVDDSRQGFAQETRISVFSRLPSAARESVSQPSNRLRPDRCLLPWYPEVTVTAAMKREASRKLALLATALGAFAKTKRDPRTQAAASGLFANVSDPVDGLWFWHKGGCCPEPLLHFAQAQLPEAESLSENDVQELRATASWLRRTGAASRGVESGFRYSPLVMADFVALMSSANAIPFPREKLASLPVRGYVRLTAGHRDSERRLSIFFTLRDGHFHVAHVLYEDSGA
jgi:hypothetical protein